MKWKWNIVDIIGGMGVREVVVDISISFNEIYGVVVMFVDVGSNSKYVGIENNVLGREVDVY